ncbi:MAG: membrane protein insertion efficiency factor YidD [bacterium]|nr:membrane protein insertion efficiency factor YidD [bacterium]
MQKIFLGTIKLYQLLVSPLLWKHCRFYPSCSDYARLAIKRYGLISGLKKGFWRITRCHPLNEGGVDLP